ncbi:hypothetical protein MNEG_13976, partial [Monoraphidium neglectum]
LWRPGRAGRQRAAAVVVQVAGAPRGRPQAGGPRDAHRAQDLLCQRAHVPVLAAHERHHRQVRRL